MNKTQSNPIDDDSPFSSDVANTNRKVRSEEESKKPMNLIGSDPDKSLSLVAAQILIYAFGLGEKDLSSKPPPLPFAIAPKRFANLLSSQDYESELCRSSSRQSRLLNMAPLKKKEQSESG